MISLDTFPMWNVPKPLQNLAQAAATGISPLRSQQARSIETDYITWLTTLFPNQVYGGFGERHHAFWSWVWAIQPNVRSSPFVAIWPRGSGKSTSAELAVCMLGALEKRKFVLFVRSTQDKADESISNIADLLAHSTIDTYYPKLGQRRLGKYGNVKGWRRNSLRTSAGLTIEGVGMEGSSIRGLKKDTRPDFIVLDDVDDRHDSEAMSKKKKEIITQSILPAGSTDCCILAIQNLIIHHGIFSQLAKPSCDFLLDRVVSGPFKAVDGLVYDHIDGRYKITKGRPTWTGQNLETCENQINTWGPSAFVREAQHDVDDYANSMFAKVKYRYCELSEVPDLTRTVCWVDPATVSKKTENSCQAIQIDGMTGNRKTSTIYRLFSWEDHASPTEVLEMALRKAVEYKCSTLGIETNQGGDLWGETYSMIAKRMKSDGEISYIPQYREKRADASTGSKEHRAESFMLPLYEAGRIVHVYGTHETLEKALRRFPISEPFDLIDAAVWSVHDLCYSISSMA